MLDLGELVARLKTDNSGLEKGLDDGESSLKGFGKVAGPALAGAGLAAGAAFVASTMEAIDQEQIAANAAAQYADPQTAKEAGQIAGNLYAGGWGEGLEDVNESVKAVMSSIGDMDDASTADIQNMTAHVMDLSKVMGIDVPRAAQIIGQAVSSGLAEDSTQAIDLLTKSLQIVPTNLREDLTDALDEYGPFLAGIGIKGERAFGLLAQAAGKGMYGIDKTGDALKEFTIRATDGSKSTSQAYKAIGLDAQQMATDVAGGGDKAAAAFQKTIDGLLRIQDPAARAQAAIGLFGTPLEDLSVQDIPKFLKSLDLGKAGLGGFEGSAKRLSDTVNNTAAASIESFKRQVQQTFVELLGNNVLPAVKVVAAFLANNFGPTLKDIGTFVSTYVMPYLRQFGNYLTGTVVPALKSLAHDALATARQQLAAVSASFRENRPQIQQFVSWVKQAAIWVGQHLVPILRGHAVGAITATGVAIRIIIASIRLFVSAINGVVTAAKQMAAGVRTTVGQVKTVFIDLPVQVLGYIGSLPGKLYNAGANMIRMLASGMASQANAAVDKVRNIVGQISKLIPGSPVKQGPLRVLNNGRAGRLMMGMLADGITVGGKDVQAAFRAALDRPNGRAGALVPRSVRAGNRGRAVLDFSGRGAKAGKALLDALRPQLRFEGIEGALG